MFDPGKRGTFPALRKSKSRIELEVALAILLIIAFCTILSWWINR